MSSCAGGSFVFRPGRRENMDDQKYITLFGVVFALLLIGFIAYFVLRPLLLTVLGLLGR